MSTTDLKAPWYPVPPYKGGKGWEGDPHILNCDGELVGVFETLADAEAAARAMNESGHELRKEASKVIRRMIDTGRHYSSLSEAHQADVRAMEMRLDGIAELCQRLGWTTLAQGASGYAQELNDARLRMIGSRRAS